MAGQIFISYRRDGGDAMAYLLWERLLSHGYKVFFDVDSLGAGKFDTRILKDIEKSSHVLLVLSPNALDRCQDKDDWVPQLSCAGSSGPNGSRKGWRGLIATMGLK